jgi:arylsulfatase A-like enzyme
MRRIFILFYITLESINVYVSHGSKVESSNEISRGFHLRHAQTGSFNDSSAGLNQRPSDWSKSSLFESEKQHSSHRRLKTADESLNDLSVDPYEKKNVLDSSTYSDILTQIYDRLDYWKGTKKDPETPDDTRESSFADCGGVCPWVETSFTPEETPTKFETMVSPHIVFVMVDDWGYNDVGYQSTYMDWGTPTIDTLASSGIQLTNYFTHPSSLPSRGAFLTGRYSTRLGLWKQSASSAELPLNESTIAQELKTAGYKTYMIGKWGLGMSTEYHHPMNRGFDYFYGHLSESVDPWLKTESLGYLDLFEGKNLVSDASELSSSLHVASLFQQKVESLISIHASDYADTPMFLYYSLPLMSSYENSYSIPDHYLMHCAEPSSTDISDETTRTNVRAYCAMTVMLDNLISNLTCSLQSYGFDKNLVMIITSDNGGDTDLIPGSNYPYIGGSGDHSRGGISVNSIVYSSSFHTSIRGKILDTVTHVTDWYPTILHAATSGQWTSPLNGNEIDGYDLWSVLPNLGDSDREEIVHAVDSTEYSLQLGMVKYDYGIKTHLSEATYVFAEDQAADSTKLICATPGFVNDEASDDLYNDDGISAYQLYDLARDPWENYDYYSSDKYLDIQATLIDRALYWQGLVADPQVPTDGNKKKIWKSCGGICAWKTSSYKPLEVTTKYKYANAPHIVFAFVDDWGWNDLGSRSSYLSWTTPTIDRLAAEGVSLTNYYSHSTCVPSRGAFLTGRYSIRLGLWDLGEGAELPLTETTIAQEMQSAGYRTYMVGKWHMGFSTTQHYPSNRGFDRFYGYLNGFVDYWTKTYGQYLDLQSDTSLVSDKNEISSSYHNGYLLQAKVEEMIHDHATNYRDQPMFLYYALQLIHGVWSAPSTYLDRCGMPSIDEVGTEYLQGVIYNYCALNVMLDEAIANLTCSLEKHGMADNTILAIVSDNGGETTIYGNNYPFRGGKGSTNRGGVSTTAIIHSPLVSENMRGMEYSGLMHVAGKSMMISVQELCTNHLTQHLA